MANNDDDRPAHELILRPNTLPKTFDEKARELIEQPGGPTVSALTRFFFGTIAGNKYLERRLQAHRDVLVALENVEVASKRLNTLGERLARRDELEVKRDVVQARQLDMEKALLDNQIKEATVASKRLDREHERVDLEHELKVQELKAQLHKLELDAQPPPPPRPRPTEAEVAKERASRFRQKGEDLLAKGAAMAVEQQRLKRAVETMVKEGLLSPEVAEQILAILEDKMFQETINE